MILSYSNLVARGACFGVFLDCEPLGHLFFLARTTSLTVGSSFVFAHSSNAPSNKRIRPSSTISSWVANLEMSVRSCDTNSNAPSYSNNTCSRASLLEMSRCVVGSSSIRTFGSSSSSLASANRVRSPPLNTETGLNTSSPLKRNLPRYVRAFSVWSVLPSITASSADRWPGRSRTPCR